MDMHADLGLLCPHIPIDTFSHGAAHILEESNFNFRYVRLSDLDISKENWLNYLQTVETLII